MLTNEQLISAAGFQPVLGATPDATIQSDCDKILFKSERMYRHNLLLVNYTIYDICRKRDTINPKTHHRDIMVLADEETASEDPYLYARVIAIFHVNVISTGPSATDFRPRRIEFLWVRWYTSNLRARAGGWNNSAMDRIQFPPVASPESFGFLDPANVMRGAHIVPAFSTGTRHMDKRGMSKCGMDSEDWNSYYVMWYIPPPFIYSG